MRKSKFENNLYQVYGINNCLSLLSKCSKYEIYKVYINKNSKIHNNSKLLSILKSYKSYTEILDHSLFNKKFNYKHSQGIVVQFKGDLYSDLHDLDLSKDNMCIVIADQLSDPQNLGQILRTGECAGIDAIILPKHNSIHLTNSVIQVSQGAFIYIDVCIETNLKSSIDYLKSKGFWVVGLENSIDSKQWYELDYKGKTVIVVGSEGSGIRKLIKNSCDFLATIDMKGSINSLNVTAATSAILFERQRQLNSK